MHIACLDVGKVVVKHFCHWRTCHIGALLRQTAVGKVAASMLRVCHVHIADDINDTAIGFFGQTFVLAAVTSLHVEDWNVQTLGAYHTQARVGVAQHKHRIRLGLCKELVGAVDDVATSGTEVITYCIHIHFRLCELQVAEEDAIEVVVVVLTRVGENHIEILTTFVDNGCQTDNLWTCTNNDDKLQLTVLFKFYV